MRGVIEEWRRGVRCRRQYELCPHRGKHTPRDRNKQRADIQGLRAFAVLAVIADHLFGQPVGGFVGVDVFFVISGFLITGLLVREGRSSARISIINFYKRRARRILPLALLVLAVTLAASYMVFSASRYEGVREDTFWAAVFMVNWHFAAAGTDYFNQNLPVSPDQHYWSLSVEEQFYVVWPMVLVGLLLLAARVQRRGGSAPLRAWVGGLAAAIVVVSFGWALLRSADDPTVSYFSTFTRAWELAVGALLAAAVPLLARIPDALRPVLGWLGVAGLIASLVVIDDEMAWPAPWAALPVLATGLVIAAGTLRDHRAQQRYMWPLTNAGSGYVGDISYSLYLWHWPIIVILGALMTETTGYYALTIALVAGISALTYRLVEKAILDSDFLAPDPSGSWRNKHSVSPGRHTQYVMLGTAAVVAALMAAVVVVPKDPPAPSEEIAATIAQLQREQAQEQAEATGVDWLQAGIETALGADVFPALNPPLGDPKSGMAPELESDTGCLNPPTLDPALCTYGPEDAKKLAVVVGDSIAISWMPALRKALPGWRVHGVALSNCPYLSVEAKLAVPGEDQRCRDEHVDVVDQIRALKPDLVLGSGTELGITRLASGANGIQAAAEWEQGVERWVGELGDSVGRVVIISSNPSGPAPQDCYTRLASPDDCASEISPFWTLMSGAEERGAESADAEYIDASDWFCVRGRCPIFALGTTVRWDSLHVTAPYAEMIAPKLREALGRGPAA